MLSVNPINFAKNYNIKKNNFISNRPVFRTLERDTFTFRGARSLNHSLQDAFDNKKICEEISKNAKVAKDNLEKPLVKEMQDIVVSETNPDGIIEPISVRIKDGTSVREKATSKFEEAIIKHDITNFINLNKSEDIKKTVEDLVGARIIVNQLDTKKNAAIIDHLISLVKNHNLKIKNIETIAPQESNLTPYFDQDDLDRLELAVNEERGESASKIEIQKVPSKSGYCAIHIDLDLSDEDLFAKNNGYKGEIQILGSDVAYFKVKQDKDIKSGHPAYNTFANHLNKYFKYYDSTKTEKENKEIANKYKEDFNEYTYRAYLFQRRKNQDMPNYDKKHLPSLEDCEMGDRLPKDLDFNYLQKIIEQCDELYDLSQKDKINKNVDIDLLQSSYFKINNMLDNTNPKVVKKTKKILDRLYTLTNTQNTMA
jgi:hypothetical protein